MKIFLKIASAALALTLVALIGLKLTVYLEAREQQHRAEKVLAAVVKLRPGATTVAELKRDVLPLDPQFGIRCDGGKNSYASFYNVPSWKLFQNEHTPEAIRAFEDKWILPRWTMFSVSLTCDSGLLTKLRVIEMQDAPGWPHPYSNSTEVLAPGMAANAHTVDQSPQGRDYWRYERGTALYQNGKLIQQSPILNRFIFLTADATPEEKRKALEFHLDCFTRWRGCQNADLILQPAPNRM